MAVGKEKACLLLGTRLSPHPACHTNSTTFSLHLSCDWLLHEVSPHLSCIQSPSLTSGTNIAFFSRFPSLYAVEFLHLFSFSKILQCICSLACCLSHPLKLLCLIQRPYFKSSVATCDQQLLPVVQKASPAPREALLGSAALDGKHHQSRVLIFLVTARCLASRTVPGTR